MIVVSGVLLVVLGTLVSLLGKNAANGAKPTIVAAVLIAAVGSTLTLTAHSPCDKESSYYCISVEPDEHNANGRLLKLDDIYHGYVDLANARNLQFAYSRVVASVVDNVRPPGSFSMLSVGGGSFTVPQYVDTTRPGSRNDVIEIDPEIVKTAQEELGLEKNGDITVHVEDARRYIGKIGDKTYDVAPRREALMPPSCCLTAMTFGVTAAAP